MRKRNVQILMSGGVRLFLSVIFFVLAFLAIKDLKNHTPSAIEIYHTQGLEVSMEQLIPFAEQGEFAVSSVGETVGVTDIDGEKSISAYIQSTTSNYDKYANLHLCEGEYFSSDVLTEPTVVIPESLSKELFGDKGKEEKRLYINEKEFAVCGVYKDSNILVQLASAKIPILYCNIPEQSNIQAEQLLIKADTEKASQQQKQEIELLLQTPLAGEIHDFGHIHQLADSILLLGFFFAGLWFILHLCIFSYKKFIFGCQYEKIFAIGVFLLTVVVFSFLLQLVRIPAVYLPENNIFDFSYYGQEILNGIQQINTDCCMKDFLRICIVFIGIEIGFLVVAVGLFWTGCQKLHQCIATWGIKRGRKRI